MFAGRSPIGLRATRFAQPASAETPFFTDLLRDAGYWTGFDGRHQHLDGKKMDADHISEMLVQENMRGKTFESRFDHFVQGIRTKAEAIQDIPGIFSGILDQVPEAQPFFLSISVSVSPIGNGETITKASIPPNFSYRPTGRTSPKFVSTMPAISLKCVISTPASVTLCRFSKTAVSAKTPS